MDSAGVLPAALEIARVVGFSRAGVEHWVALFDDLGVPCSPIKNYAEVVDDPQVEHLGLVRDIELPNGIKTRTIAFPVGITNYDFEISLMPPRLGEHTDEVLSEWL